MRIISICISLVFFFAGFSFGQKITGSSGKQTYNLKKTEEPKKDENSSGSTKTYYNIAKKDEAAPILTVESPVFSTDVPFETSGKLLVVSGKVEDESGVFEVLVNRTDATVNENGKFSAKVPLAVGENAIIIKATDIHYNTNTTTYKVVRTTAAPLVVNDNRSITNPNIKINLENPQNLKTTVSSKNFELRACITSNDKIIVVSIYQNNKLIGDYKKGEVAFRSDCEFLVKETMVLVDGENQIKVLAKTANSEVETEFTVNYDFIAAKYYALVIGVEDYDDGKINDLDNPIEDAQKLIKVLTTEYTFQLDDIVFLENPTKAEIVGTLHKMRSYITTNDNLLIFYAGHGYWDDGMGVGYWLPSDSEKDNPVNWFSNTDLSNYLGAIKTKHTLLIADACFSGGIFKTRNAFDNDMAIERLYELPSRKAITSGALKEVPDESVFIEYLIKRLNENEDKYLTTEQLFSNMRIAIMNNSSNVPQYGTIKETGDEGGDFIFIKKE